jgi:hypothetical protein
MALEEKSRRAGDRDRTGMASLEGWGSTIELHPRGAPLSKQRKPVRIVVARSLMAAGLLLWLECMPNGAGKSLPIDSVTQCCLASPGRSVVASAPALGAGDREFESPRPDHMVRFD